MWVSVDLVGTEWKGRVTDYTKPPSECQIIFANRLDDICLLFHRISSMNLFFHPTDEPLVVCTRIYVYIFVF